MKITVEENQTRLDKYLSENTEYSRSMIQKMLTDGFILVNGETVKPKYNLKENDEIEIKDGFIQELTIEGEDMPLDVVYEDEDLIVINKPSGMVVHPGNGNTSGTLVNALINHTNKLSDLNGEVRPGIVHRIDKDTSGLILVAKNNKAHELLGDAFKNKTIKREYIALLVGDFKSDTATIDAPIGRDPSDRKKMIVTEKNAKEAITHLTVIKRYGDYTLANLKLETGRTHQIRVHLKYIGYPVHNDPVYIKNKTTEFGQFLHSAKLEFMHPIKKELLVFESPLPKEFKEFLEKLETNDI